MLDAGPVRGETVLLLVEDGDAQRKADRLVQIVIELLSEGAGLRIVEVVRGVHRLSALCEADRRLRDHRLTDRLDVPPGITGTHRRAERE